IGPIEVNKSLKEKQEAAKEDVAKTGKDSVKDMADSSLRHTLKDLVGDEKSMDLFADFSARMFGKGKELEKKWKSILSDANTGTLGLAKQKELLKNYMQEAILKLSTALHSKVESVIKSREQHLDSYFGKENQPGTFDLAVGASAMEKVMKVSDKLSAKFIASIGSLAARVSQDLSKDVRKALLTAPEAWTDKGLLKDGHPLLKKLKADVDKAIDNYIKDEVERVNLMAGKGEVLTTGYLENKANPESPTSLARTEAWVKEHILPRLKKSGEVYLTLTGNTSVEGYKSVNDRLSKKRVDAKKRVILAALKKALGKDWARYKDKVHFKVEHKQIEPKLALADMTKKQQDEMAKAMATNKVVSLVNKGLKQIGLAPSLLSDIVSAFKQKNRFADAIGKVNQITPAEKRLHAIIVLFARTDAKTARAILREYNVYREKAVKNPDEAALWLNTKSKYLKGNAPLRKYLHKYVGRSRSTEIAVNHPKQKKLDDQLLSMWDAMKGGKMKPKGAAQEMYADYLATAGKKLNKLANSLQGAYPELNPSIENGVLSLRGSDGKLKAEFGLTEDLNEYIAYDAKGVDQGTYTYAQLQGNGPDFLLA
ncbi:hypothetical protein ACFL3T_05190, partial [Patescibacteria group bacterium]